MLCAIVTNIKQLIDRVQLQLFSFNLKIGPNIAILIQKQCQRRCHLALNFTFISPLFLILITTQSPKDCGHILKTRLYWSTPS